MDWFFKSRTPAEISRRCQTLISLVLKEAGLYEGKHAHPSAYPADHKEGDLVANTKKRANPSLSPSSTSSKRSKAIGPPPMGPGVTPSVLTPNPYQQQVTPQIYGQTPTPAPAPATAPGAQVQHQLPPQQAPQAPNGQVMQPAMPPMNLPPVPFPDQPYPPQSGK